MSGLEKAFAALLGVQAADRVLGDRFAATDAYRSASLGLEGEVLEELRMMRVGVEVLAQAAIEQEKRLERLERAAGLGRVSGRVQAKARSKPRAKGPQVKASVQEEAERLSGVPEHAGVSRRALEVLAARRAGLVAPAIADLLGLSDGQVRACVRELAKRGILD